MINPYFNIRIVILLYCMRMGLPEVILSDQGCKFNYELHRKLSSVLGFEHRLKLPISTGMKLGACAEILLCYCKACKDLLRNMS